jgi:hypothetical protein
MDAVDEAFEELLPTLIEAGHLTERGHSPTGSFWAFSETGVRRVEELGCD